MTPETIIITGAACRFAGTPNADLFWRNTLANEPLLSARPAPRELLDKAAAAGVPWLCPPRATGLLEGLYNYDPGAFDAPPDAAPDALFAAQLALEALRDAGLSTRSLDPGRTGVHIGCATPFTPALEAALQHLHLVDQTVALARNLAPRAGETRLAALGRHLRAALPPFTQSAVRDAHPHALAATTASLLGFAGPARVACDGHAAFFGALQMALDDLRGGRADAALVGAVSPPFTAASLLAACALQETTRHDVPHALCKSADGMAPGEGGAFFVLQRATPGFSPVATPYAEAGAVSLLFAPGPNTVARVMEAALRAAGAEPCHVGYVEANGSGVPREDAAELEAMSTLFDPASPAAIGTGKPMFGHTLAASGAAGFLRAALALRHRILPPSVVTGKPHPRLAQSRALYVPAEPRPWVSGAAQRFAGATAMDPSGVCGHALLRECKP